MISMFMSPQNDSPPVANPGTPRNGGPKRTVLKFSTQIVCYEVVYCKRIIRIQNSFSPYDARPSTSCAYAVEPVRKNVPDRPSLHDIPKRKSRSEYDLVALRGHDVALYIDKMKPPRKNIVVEPDFDYTPIRADELKLKRGSTIKVIRRDDEEGWWYGETPDGKKGFFPQNHVRLAKGLAKEVSSDEIEFKGLIGAGGFSVVKKAAYKNREVAVKIPHAKFSKDEILVAVREEASIFQMLDHPNILEMYGVVVGEEPALILELCSDSLANISKKSISLSEEIIGNWGVQVAKGMSYLHSLNVLHRDLKAANVLIKEKVCDCYLNVQMDRDEQLVHTLQSPDGICAQCGGSALNCLTLKIADLGLSKKLQVTCCRMSVAGTVPYLAPEVIRDRKCSKAMDVWSFGLVLWEVLTGATPFEGLHLGAVQLKIGTFVKQQIPSSCPPDLKRIIESCWRDNPLERPTFRELIVELQEFSDKFRTVNPNEQLFLENSLHTLRKSMIEEITEIANEMKKKAAELDKREENIKKEEQELELKKMIFELQQTLSERPPKEKPLPPKRCQPLKCEDISKPYDLKAGISLTRNMQMIKSLNGNTPSEINDITEQGECKHDNNALLASFATLPRAPKKLSTERDTTFADLNFQKQRPPSKSIPDLLKLAPQTPFIRNASPKLHRVNACKIKRGSTRSTAEDEIDESCIELVKEKDLESLRTNNKYDKGSLDHLATPRRVAPLPPTAKGIRSDHRNRSSSAADEKQPKNNKEEGRSFFPHFFKHKDKSPARSHQNSTSSTISRPAMMPMPVNAATTGAVIAEALSSSSRHPSPAFKGSPKRTTPKGGGKKGHSADPCSDYGLTPNSEIYVKATRGDRRPSGLSQSSAAFSIINGLVPIYSSGEESAFGNIAQYEKLSRSTDSFGIDNLSYKPPSEFPRSRERASTSQSHIGVGDKIQPMSMSPESSCSRVQVSYENGADAAIIENLGYKPPFEIKLPQSITRITLDSPVEGGLDIMHGRKLSYTSVDSGSVPSFEESLVCDPSSRNTVLDDQYFPLSTVQRKVLKKQPRIVADECIQTDISFAKEAPSISSENLRGGSSEPPNIPAPALPLYTSRPPRPFTLDLNSPVTAAESGISTAGSSYRSFSSAEFLPTDPFDSAQRTAPPLPPRSNQKRTDDETASRQRLSPVSQSP